MCPLSLAVLPSSLNYIRLPLAIGGCGQCPWTTRTSCFAGQIFQSQMWLHLWRRRLECTNWFEHRTKEQTFKLYGAFQCVLKKPQDFCQWIQLTQNNPIFGGSTWSRILFCNLCLNCIKRDEKENCIGCWPIGGRASATEAPHWLSATLSLSLCRKLGISSPLNYIQPERKHKEWAKFTWFHSFLI